MFTLFLLKHFTVVFFSAFSVNTNNQTPNVFKTEFKSLEPQTYSISAPTQAESANSNFGKKYWQPDETGIHYSNGAVGIGTDSKEGSLVSIEQIATNGHSSALDIYSSDNFQTVTRFRNTTVNQEYQFNLAGNENFDQHPGSFGIFHNNTLSWVWHTNPSNDYFGIGSYSHKQSLPKSRLHVFNGDVNIDEIGKGIIMKSPNGNCWRVTVDNNGGFVSTAISCPR